MAGGVMHGRGDSMRDGGRACQILRDTVIRSMSGQYASDWNAFLFCYAPVLFFVMH